MGLKAFGVIKSANKMRRPIKFQRNFIGRRRDLRRARRRQIEKRAGAAPRAYARAGAAPRAYAL